jgi:hypothetical protein
MIRPASPSHGLPSWLRPALWSSIALSFILIVVHLALYSTVLTMPDGWSFVLIPVVLLVIYAASVLALPTIARITGGADALHLGTRLGLLVAGVEVINISLESLVAMPQTITTAVTGLLMLTTFTLWGVTGFLAAFRSRSIGLGALAAVWCAMVTMLLAVTYGYALLVVVWPRLTTMLATDPDFLRSHWGDLRAFAIANTLSNGAVHLLEAPIIALVVGGLGAILGALLRRMKASSAEAVSPR